MLVNLQTVRPPIRHAVTFTKPELNAILSLYSFQVAQGSWRDYAMDFTRDMAMFSMFRHAGEKPLVSVIKMPANTATGFVFEIFFDQKRLSRTADLHKSLEALRTSIMN